MTVRRTLIILTVLTLVLPAVVSLVSANQAASAQLERMETMETLQTYMVQRGSILTTIPAVGTVQAQTVADLAFLTSGQIEEVLVAENAFVEAGTPLVQLKNRAQMLAFEQANLNYEVAIRQQQDLLVVDEDAIAIAEANLESARGSYYSMSSAVSPHDVEAAELRYQQAVAGAEGAQQARQEASPSLTDEARALLDAQAGQAAFNAEVARLQMEEIRVAGFGELGAANARIAQAERELERARAGASDFDIQQAQVAVELAELQLDQAQLDFERAFLVAPFAGVVTSLNAEVGQRVTAGIPLVQLVNINPLSLTGTVDETDLQQIVVGLPAQVELDALSNVIMEGTVAELASAGDNQNGLVNYDIELQLNITDARVRPGMTAEANIIVQRLDNALSVPNRFVQRDRETGTFFVNILLPDGTLQPQPVTVGTRGDDNSEILAGLQGGETLAFSPQRPSTGFFGG